MSGILEKIVQQTTIDVGERKRNKPQEQLSYEQGDHRFFRSLTTPELSLIAEIKPKSPSHGILRDPFDLDEVLRAYIPRAHAMSVLCDTPFFDGSYSLLSSVRSKTETPLLAKDFVVDPYQIYEARSYGADAILLIVRALSDAQLSSFLELAHELGMDALVETHDDDELSKALSAGAKIVGVNARNLDTLQIDLEESFRRLKRIPNDIVKVAESGLKTRQDIENVTNFADAVLIGTTFMRASNMTSAIEELGWSA